MISDDGFPVFSESFLAGQDILYTQFNDVSFYIEDTDQEHLYFNILKRLFEDVKFEKIFPLDGKNNLKKHAKDHVGDKSKIYIADIDFEDILEIREYLENVFYLNKYSIENFFVDKSGLFELIREKNPKLKDNDINGLFDLNSNLQQCKVVLSDLACTFIVIQKYSLGKEYFGITPARDFHLEINPPQIKNKFIPAYLDEIDALLKNRDGRFSLKSKQQEFKKHFRSLNNALINIPGKYLLNVIKYQLERAKLIHQMSIESLTYKLSKECSVDSFAYLRTEILEYME